MGNIIQQQDSRRVFIDILCKLAEKDDKICLIICDTGFNYIEKFQEKFPNRFFNFGVTEQSSMIIASALALSGFKPYFYSIIGFSLFRPYEMVRNAICYHNANVKIIGVKGSEKYKFLGFSHNIYGDEDIKVLKGLPNMLTYLPKSSEEIKTVIEMTYHLAGPAYIRL